MESAKYMVRVSCMTFNQAAYIEDTMDGFCLQETTFPFVCTIFDDASTDGEQEVINSYLSKHFSLDDENTVRKEETDDYCLTFAQHKTNKNCYFVVLFLKYNHYQIKKLRRPYIEEWHNNSKYLAICEGDDYWIDPLKLQKQVAYLESHPDCALCFTGAKVIFDNDFENKDVKEYKSLYDDLEERDYDGTELLSNWVMPTPSVIYKSDMTIKTDKRFMFGDIITGLSAAEQGTVHCIPEKTVVYRRNYNGLSVKHHSLSRRINHYIAIAEVFGDKYKIICERLIKSNIASYLLTGDKNDRKYAVSFLKNKPLYIPNVMFKMAFICINALKKKIFG